MTKTLKLPVAAWVALLVVAGGGLGRAAKEIELFPSAPSKPEGETPSPDARKPAEALRPATLLREAAERAGLPLKGDLISLAAEALAPKTAEAGKEKPPAAGAKAAVLPDWLGSQPYQEYKLVAVAAGSLAHPKGQALRAVLFEFASSEEAWGFWSVGRGEKAEPVGQAANLGKDLRVWQGQFVGVLSLDPPDPRLDELRLTTFGRALCGVTPGGGRRPEMAGWLPATNQIAQTLTYFHANGPLGAEAMALSAETEGVTAQYKVGQATDRAFAKDKGAPAQTAPAAGGGVAAPPKLPRETIERGVVVRYPTVAAALKAWDAFVAQAMGLNPAEGTRGGRRAAPAGGGWNGIQMRGRVCAFAIGAPTRNQAQILLLQSLSSAHG
jgi:hypothetical protein